MHFPYPYKSIGLFVHIIKKWSKPRDSYFYIAGWDSAHLICTNTASGVWPQGLGVEFMGLLYIQNIFTDCLDAPAQVFEYNFFALS